MKKFILFNFLVFSVISCDKIFKEREVVNEEDSKKREYLLGGDKDENGCISSAGYVWSALKNDCIRVFEVGYRLNPIQKSAEDSVLSAFVIFNDNKDKVELFIPTESKSIILDKEDTDTFGKEKYVFNSKEFYILVDKIKSYEAAKEELKNIIDVDDDVIDTL